MQLRNLLLFLCALSVSCGNPVVSNSDSSTQSNSKGEKPSPRAGDKYFNKDKHLCNRHNSQDQRQVFAMEFARALNHDNTRFKDATVGATGKGNKILLLEAEGVAEKDCSDLADSVAIQNALDSGFKEFHCLDSTGNFRQIYLIQQSLPKP